MQICFLVGLLSTENYRQYMTHFKPLNEIGLTHFLKEQLAALSSKTRQTNYKFTYRPDSQHPSYWVSFSLYCVYIYFLQYKHYVVFTITKTFFLITFRQSKKVHTLKEKQVTDSYKNNERVNCSNLNGKLCNKNCGGGHRRCLQFSQSISLISLVLMRLTRDLMVVFHVCITSLALQGVKNFFKKAVQEDR